jgi:hypothetical protein
VKYAAPLLEEPLRAKNNIEVKSTAKRKGPEDRESVLIFDDST